MIVSIIAAVAENNIIGFKGKIPWRLPDDLQHLKILTQNNLVILGLNTYISMEKYYDASGREMPAKKYLVLSDDSTFKTKRKNVQIVTNFDHAFKIAENDKVKEVFIIGGALVYKQSINFADKIYLTKIHKKFEGDVYFPKIDKNKWELIKSEKHHYEEGNLDYEFQVLKHNPMDK
jgi:dihydrofolate reductase